MKDESQWSKIGYDIGFNIGMDYSKRVSEAKSVSNQFLFTKNQVTDDTNKEKLESTIVIGGKRRK